MYVQGYRLIEDKAELRFGSMFHDGREELWRSGSLDAAIVAAAAGAADEYEAAKVRVLLTGYAARWGDGPPEDFVDAEVEFRASLTNPETGAASRTFVLGGKIDALMLRRFNELKTTSEDIGPGSIYWRRLTLDPQVSTYYAGAKALGHEVDSCEYDVVRKPALRPLKATPPEARKYTKSGQLYATQREVDETPEEYAERCAAAIAAAPEKYFGRGLVVRLEEDEREAAFDVWQLARALREGELAGRHPRNPDACSRYGRTCAYFDVCCRTASIDDPQRFRRAERAHEELTAQLPEQSDISKEESAA